MENPPKICRVLLIDGIPLIRLGVRTLITQAPTFTVCAEVGNAPRARQACAEQRPDLIVLDLEVPQGDGVELLREFRQLHPPARALVLSQREDGLSLQRAFRAGARGYVSNREDPAEVLLGLHRVLAGGLFASPRVSHLLLERMTMGSVRGLSRELMALSDRELQVFRLLGRALGPTAIARELGVCVKTIETHQLRIREKLGLKTAEDLRRKSEALEPAAPKRRGP